MKKFHHHLAALAVLASVGCATQGAMAQAADDTAPPPSSAAYERGPHHRAMAHRGLQHHQKRLDDLKTHLELQPAQEGAWEAFADALRPAAHHGEGDPALKREDLRTMKTPQRLDAMREHRLRMGEAMDRREEAIRAFYAVLDERQQTVFDEEFARHPAQGHRGPGDGKGKPPHHRDTKRN